MPAIVAGNIGAGNPMIAQLLGLCPLLAVTTTALNGLLLGVATLMTLLGAGVAVSLLRPFIAHETRLLVYVIVIGVMVGCADTLMAAFLYESHLTLGLFIPLIVTNCAIFATIETSATRGTPPNRLLYNLRVTAWDCLTRGLGLLFALSAIGIIRESIALGAPMSVFGTTGDVHLQLAILPPGAFFALVILIAAHRWYTCRT